MRRKIDIAFNDKASLILREMLADPTRRWVVRDFVSRLHVGQGWVSEVWASLRDNSYLKGEFRGRTAGAVLRNVDELVEEWTRHYSYDLNEHKIYYSDDPDILPKLKEFFKKRNQESAYALTLHTGANLLTHYVLDKTVYAYLDPERFDKLLHELRIALDLKELKQGGNVHIIYPFYKRSVFHGLRKIKGYSVVSNLQLYLDLFHFPARGEQHAEYLVRILKEEGQRLA